MFNPIKNKYMKKHKYLYELLGVLFIIIGVVLYPTPIPGTTLIIILGLIFIIGKNKTLYLLKKHLNKDFLRSLKIDKIIKKL
jgi:uncharacterized membrane protein HdeD (DUF308 family)